VLAEADVVLVIDSDVPWIPAVNRPSGDAAIYYVDVDPLKSQLQMWHVPARRFAAARFDDFHVSFGREVDLPGVALAAGGRIRGDRVQPR
jgi:hypothetical protein